LIPVLADFIPANYNKYIEPFVGGGALYFYLNPDQAVIADSNLELITTYKTIRDNVDDVIGILASYRNEESFYYKIRSLNTSKLSVQERAARLIFLNKTCFNGLYRVNKKGVFNVPYGKGNNEFLNEDLLRDVAVFLRNTLILHSDYIDVLREYAEEGDLIFLDPPYYPVSQYADFKRYTKEFFYHQDHINLKNEFARLTDIGCHVLLTNSSHPVILDLYKDYDIRILNTKRLISSNPDTRNGKDILVIGKR